MQMSKESFRVTVAVVLFGLAPSVPQSAPRSASNGRAWDNMEWDYRPLHSSDLIVRGSIISVSDGEVSSSDFWMESPGSRPPDRVAFVTLRIQEVLRGPSATGDITFLVYREPDETRIVYQIDSEMLACLYYHQRLDIYYQSNFYSRYLKGEAGWVSGPTPAGEKTIDDAELRGKIEETSIESVIAEAALVVEGVIETVKVSGLVGPDSSSAELVTIGLRVEVVEKGNASRQIIPISILTRGAYWPSWRREVPVKFTVGQRWLCFLRSGEIGWYPFAGSNGLFEIKDGKPIYAERIEYWHSMIQIQATLRGTNR